MKRIALRHTNQQRIGVSQQQQSIGFGFRPTLVISGGSFDIDSLRRDYAAQFVKNNDGDDTYSMVMPMIKGVVVGGSAIVDGDGEDTKLVKKAFSARFVKNNDGENTYSMILPHTAEIVKNDDGIVTIKM